MPGVFAHADGRWLPLYWDSMNNFLRFIPNSPSATFQLSEPRSYGVTVFADGRPVSLVRISAVDYSQVNGRIFEEFSANIPPGTSAITVEINDFYMLPMYPSGNFINPHQRTMGLAFVELSGEHLMPREPVVDATTPPAVRAAPNAPFPDLAIETPPPAASPREASGNPSSTDSESGYFVGSPMPLPPPATRPSPEAQSRAVRVPTPASHVYEAPLAALPPVVYQVDNPAGNRNTQFAAGAVLYIVLAVIALAAVVLKGKGKKRD